MAGLRSALSEHPDLRRRASGWLLESALSHAATSLGGARRPQPVDVPEAWEPWLRKLFPGHVAHPFADWHREMWEWLWSIDHGIRSQPFVGIAPRGGGKSTNAELGTTATGVRGVRDYALYVRSTQDAADKSVANIAALLESESIARHYPAHADRALSKYGHSKAWRRNRLVTAGGFTVDAVGLDTAVRGLKFGDQRPDLIVIDDVDEQHDSPHTTRKKIETLTKAILPAGASHATVLAIQNLIIPHGIFARLADGRADFLADRIVTGPHPAVVELETAMVHDEQLERFRAVITGGRPTWQGQDLKACQGLIDQIGLSAFLAECQHEVNERTGALWQRRLITRIDTAPPLRRVVVGVDPSGGGDDIGIIVAGLGHDGRGYVLADVSQPGKKGPLNWGRAAVQAYLDRQGDRILGERNYGGDMVESNIQVAARDLSVKHVPVKMVTASRGKAVRAEPVAALYEEGRVDHVGTFPELEAEMTGWTPGDSHSPNRLDALVWVMTELMLGAVAEPRLRVLGGGA